MALIPKKSEAYELKDFHPISLESGVYKIISKVLANRMSTIMEQIISKHQNAFVWGRQILYFVGEMARQISIGRGVVVGRGY